MPTPITIALSIAAGVSISAGLSALFVALRKQQPALQLTFAVMCLLIALKDIAQLLTYHTADIEAHSALFKTQLTLALMIGAMMLWFTSRYTGLRQNKFLIGWTGFALLLIIINTLMPFGMLFSNVHVVDAHVLPWGEPIFLAKSAAAPTGLFYALFPLGVFVYTVYACVQQHIGGNQRAALILGGVAFLIAVTATHDLIVAMLSIAAVSLYEFALLVLVLVITVQFSDEIIRAESDLRDAQDKLENRVAEKTSELREANVKLAREVSVRKQAEESLQSRVRDLNVLHRISQDVTTITDLPSALDMVCDSVTQLFNASGCYLFSPDAQLIQSPALQTFIEKHNMRGMLARGVEPLDVPAIRHSANLGEPVIVENVTTQENVRGIRGPLLHPLVNSLMLVPLKVRGDVIGCLAVTSQQSGRRFTDTELSLFENIAADVAGALENSRLYEQAKEVAVSIERQRLARELHDSVTQSLYSLTLLANGWGTMARKNALTDVPGSFRQLVEVGQQALREMRLLIHQLRPPILEEEGLEGALRQRLETVERRVEIKTSMHAEGNLEILSLDVQEQLFQIAQEALNNSLRHAAATTVGIDIRLEHDVVRMLIEDDGIGYDMAHVSTGVGTLTMQERARQISGSVNVRSAINEGTTVEVVVHLNPQPAL